jgi:hypothetical protein
MQAPVGRHVEKKSFLDAPVAFAQGSLSGDAGIGGPARYPPVSQS